MRTRRSSSRRPLQSAGIALLALGLALFAILAVNQLASAGGPLLVGGTSGVSGQPFTWDTGLGEVQYRTDGGGLGVRDNATADAGVASMFQVWEDVPTASLGFNRAGPINPTGAFTDGDVSTMAEFDAVDGDCQAGNQNPIMYDADGSVFDALLGPGSGVIGFAGICRFSSAGRITAAEAALNGAFRDGLTSNDELTDNEFDAVFIHEFGHFFGMDHSQINLNCLGSQGGCASGSDDAFGLPTMFPFLIGNLTETAGVHPARTLSTDDTAWVSKLYPLMNFSSSFGHISGTIFFSDGVTPAQGVNVIARSTSTPRRTAVSVVSGYLFTVSAGQSLNNPGGSPFGSRDTQFIGTFDIPVPPGSYTLEIESVFASFTSGSSVGPLDPPIPNPGAAEFWDSGESATDSPTASTPISVSAGATAMANIIINGTQPRFDSFETELSRNNTRTNASPITAGTHRGSISPFADEDFYSFSATSGTTYTISTNAQRLSPSSPLDSVMEILDSTGARVSRCGSSGTSSCLNDDISFPSVLDSGLTFQPNVSATYFIHILDFRGDGRPDLIYDLVLTVPAPLTNDGFSSAIDITSTPFTHTTDTTAATIETGDPTPTCGASSRGHSVWYKFTAPSGGSVSVNTTGSTYDTVLSVWTGSPGSFTQVACNDDSGGTLQSSVSFTAVGGTTYNFMISSFGSGAGGTLVFNLSFQSTAVGPIPGGNFLSLIPHSAVGGGYISRLFITNLTANSNALTINRITQGGTLVSSTPTTLAAAATMQVVDAETQRTSALTVNWFAIASEFPIAASVLFDFEGGSVGLDPNIRQAVGALASPELSAFTAPVRFDSSVGATIGLALANRNSSSTTVTMKLIDGNGTVVATDSLSVAAFSQTAFVVSDRPAFQSLVTGPGGFLGSLAVTTTDPTKPVAALVVGGVQTELFTLPVVSGTAR